MLLAEILASHVAKLTKSAVFDHLLEALTHNKSSSEIGEVLIEYGLIKWGQYLSRKYSARTQALLVNVSCLRSCFNIKIAIVRGYTNLSAVRTHRKTSTKTPH